METLDKTVDYAKTYIGRRQPDYREQLKKRRPRDRRHNPCFGAKQRARRQQLIDVVEGAALCQCGNCRPRISSLINVKSIFEGERRRVRILQMKQSTFKQQHAECLLLAVRSDEEPRNAKWT